MFNPLQIRSHNLDPENPMVYHIFPTQNKTVTLVKQCHKPAICSWFIPPIKMVNLRLAHYVLW